MTNEPRPEREIKLLVPAPSVLRELLRLRSIGPYPVKPTRPQRLHSIYLDTENYDLTRHRVALRVRRDGKAWEMTAKWRGHVTGTMHERPELNVPLGQPPTPPFELPDGPLRPYLVALIRRKPLGSILVTNIHRRRFDVFAPDQPRSGEPIAELAIDTVKLSDPDTHRRHANGRPADDTYSEVEIEQRSATAEQLNELGARLAETFALAPSSRSKFERGLSFLGITVGEAIPAAPVQPDDAVEAAARKLIGVQLQRLLTHDPGARLGKSTEAVHRMRVTTRRLRAIVENYEAGMPRRLHAGLLRDLRWLGQALGTVRDLDVQRANLEGRVRPDHTEEAGGLDCFDRYLERQRARGREELLAALDSQRYFRLLDRLDRFAAARTHGRLRASQANEPVGAVGRQSVERGFRKLLAAGAKIGPNPSDADLHALRKRAKRFRYLLETLRDVDGPAGRKLARELIRLQDLLGQYNDARVAVLAAESFRHQLPSALSPTADRQLLEYARTRAEYGFAARTRFRSAWKRLSGHPTRKLVRSVLKHLKT